MSQQHAHAEGRLFGTNELFVTAAIVTSDEQSILIDWTEEKRRSSRLLNNPQDPETYLTPYLAADGKLTRFTRDGPRENKNGDPKLIWIPEVRERFSDPLPKEFWRIRARVVELLGLESLDEDPYKGSFLSYIAPGGGVHRHCDATLKLGAEEFHILRCNVLFKSPEVGGQPVIEGKELEVPDRGMWVFYPTQLFHSATEVRGSEFRGLLSFGFLVGSASLWARRFRIARAVQSEYGLEAGNEARTALIEIIRRSSQAATIDNERRELIEFIISCTGYFSVYEAAQALEREPATIWKTLLSLQQSQFIESNSSVCSEQGKVTVF